MIPAAVAAALAVLLLVPSAEPGIGRPRVAGGRPRWMGWLPLVVPGVVLMAPGPAALAVVLGGAVAGGLALTARRRRRRQAVGVADRVLESCELLAADLAAGQPPGAALRRAAVAWPALAPAAEAFGLGGDVPGALRRLAARSGAGDLRLVAAAWSVAHHTGQGLADALTSCAASLREARATRRLVEGELASAHATARVVAALPALALVLGAGSGGDPLGFLLGTPPGLACLAGGLGLGLAGLWWIERIASAVGSP